jgi:5-methylcytosine-specific restriction endonuclease McrA
MKFSRAISRVKILKCSDVSRTNSVTIFRVLNVKYAGVCAVCVRPFELMKQESHFEHVCYKYCPTVSSVTFTSRSLK